MLPSNVKGPFRKEGTIPEWAREAARQIVMQHKDAIGIDRLWIEVDEADEGHDTRCIVTLNLKSNPDTLWLITKPDESLCNLPGFEDVPCNCPVHAPGASDA